MQPTESSNARGRGTWRGRRGTGVSPSIVTPVARGRGRGGLSFGSLYESSPSTGLGTPVRGTGARGRGVFTPAGAASRGRGGHSSAAGGDITPPASPTPQALLRGRSPTPVQLPVDRDIMDGLEPTVLQLLSVPRDNDLRDVEIRDMRELGSYNWTNASAPTIVVPGAPRMWEDPRVPFVVEPDTGVSFVDQNSYRSPNGQSLIPLLAAVERTHELNTRHSSSSVESFDWAGAEIDLITDRNSLRKLLRWIDGRSTVPGGDGKVKDFRIDTQLAPGGRTVLFTRWEKRNEEQMTGWTYGFNFEKKTTSPPRGVPESTGHHRIISYDFRGIKIVMRFEVDACVPGPAGPTRPGDTGLDDLTSRLANMRVNNGTRGRGTFSPNNRAQNNFPSVSSLTSTRATASPEPFTASHGLTIIEGGPSSRVSHSQLLELTTRSTFRANAMDWHENYPQLWLSGTPYHHLGVHNRGRFERIVKRQLGGPEFDQVRRDVMPSMRKLRTVLGEVIGLVKAHGARGRLTLVCRDGRLGVYERESMESCLPEEMLERFDE
ncbi:hypothetical protein HMN09_00926400 [Mycena chlorophos]|uniref:Geranylgeranyl pyrophosphate synthetase n=1 Tax=Mycena chlorophos TaxID=658473 RepID=A0A8H6SKB2_MYCCL|nr:hypothetical protein HMN09_00926400 [Mycena chlorophos]